MSDTGSPHEGGAATDSGGLKDAATRADSGQGHDSGSSPPGPCVGIPDYTEECGAMLGGGLDPAEQYECYGGLAFPIGPCP